MIFDGSPTRSQAERTGRRDRRPTKFYELRDNLGPAGAAREVRSRRERVAPTKSTVRDVAADWLGQLDVKPRSLESYDYHLRHNILPTLGSRKIQDITPRDVVSLIGHLRDKRKLATQTQAGAIRTLSGVFAHAVWMGLIPASPVAAVPRSKRPKARLHEHRYLASEEIAVLLGKASAAYRPIIAAAVWTGMRENELLGLIWADVDLREAKIHLRAQLSRPKIGRPAERVSLKTGIARTVEIDPELVAFLRLHRERAFGLGVAKESDFVFCTLPEGRPVHHRNLTKAFGKASDRAELNPDGKRRLRFHDLRRTYASILIAGGCDGPYVAQQLGHSVAMLYGTYAGLFNARGQAQKGLAAIAAARSG